VLNGPVLPILELELRAVPEILTLYLVVDSGVSLAWLICLLLEHYVNMVEDLVVELVRPVVVVLRKLLLGHLTPKPGLLEVLAVTAVLEKRA
jgi:hypothetical protein